MHCKWYPSMPYSRSGWGGSRPTPKGEVEGDLVQAHSQGGKLRGIWFRPHPRGKLRGICLGGACSRGCLVLGEFLVETPLPDGYCCGRYASYWNAFLLKLLAFLNHNKTLNICFPNLLPLFFGNIHIGTLNYCSSKQSSHSMFKRVSYFCKRGNFVSNYVISSHTHSVSVLYNFSSATLCGTYTYFH